MNSFCSLCATPIHSHPFIDGNDSFCCPGCLTVFRILSAKNALKDYQDNHLFKLAVRSGLISNPDLLENIRQNQNDLDNQVLERWHLQILDMWCPSCAEVIQLILNQEKGVKNCIVDYSTDLATIEFSPMCLSKEKMTKLISDLGYRPQALTDGSQKAVSLSLYLRFIVASFCALNIMMFAYPLYATFFDFDGEGYGNLFAYLSFYLSLPVLFYSAYPIFKRFIISLKVGQLGMETLVVLGVISAMIFSCYELWMETNRVYFDSMCVIIVFVLLGKIMEAKAKFSSKDTLLRLMQALPRKGRKRFSDGKEAFVLLKEIQIGDQIVTTTGEKIVLDGIIVEGEGLIDESLMTGESIPKLKRKGDRVLAGTILQQGKIVFDVKVSPDESTLKRIIEIIDCDFGKKTVYSRPVDRMIPWMIPMILLIACLSASLTYLWGITEANKTVLETAILRGMAVLLISCPCAIGIAAPLAESHLIQAFATFGAIIRNRVCLQWLGRETLYVFDKTGTVTEGKFEVLAGLQNLTQQHKQILKGLCSYSNHPISRAIFHTIDQQPLSAEKIEEFIGKGLKGVFNDKAYFLGSKDFLISQGFSIDSAWQALSDVQTESYFAEEGGSYYTLTLGDRIKQSAELTIQALKSRTLLLSGDAFEPVQKVAMQCGFKGYLANCSPLHKREVIDQERKKGEIVCMLGDGINDALAITAAHVGISVVSATDISIQVSDILLTTDRLDVIPKLHALARKGRKIITQNLFWAFFYNVFGIGLAAFGMLSPIFAAFAMVMSSLIVLFNAKRLR